MTSDFASRRWNSCVGALVQQPSAKDERVLPGNGHALAVDRVEAARGIAGDDETIGPGPERVVMPEPIFGPTICRDSRDRDRLADGLVRSAAFEGCARTP